MNSMLNKAIVMLSIFFGSAAAYGGDMYKWKDENGQTHYGNSAAEAKRKQAESVKLIDNSMVPPGKPEEADGRNRELRKQDDKPVESSPPQKNEQDDTSKLSKCEQEMKKYRESQECFAPYRNATGGIREEGYQHCTEVAQPALCN
ncbi:DUF4124 domain-containing protein [Sideroxydans lithotrophicus]|uniref:DUF4124 domain-containing protein n=1 Tax=Sideroxydans lithotrophicus (strain ES-1) TaxID=580332 RepID=D5CS60_SIDLE|nr:DUF4124 domain-containing protein [Sideroxydans lithotrophicus]ADE11796.1 hypothetical protein Slit_1563 [Sideroxydans lithotrophicus ES-1]